MKRQIPGLHREAQAVNEIPEGLFLVRVERGAYRYHPQKPFFLISFAVLEPEKLKGKTFSSRIYCTRKALWKLSWFLRDFGYDAELLNREEVDEKALAGLRGMVKVSHTSVNGHSYLNLDGFAPVSAWEEVSAAALEEPSDDL